MSGPAEHGFKLKTHTETIYLLLWTNTKYFYMIITTHYKATTSVTYVLAMCYKWYVARCVQVESKTDKHWSECDLVIRWQYQEGSAAETLCLNTGMTPAIS